VHTVQNVMKLH